ncbi:DNA endonuclease [Nanoarchaeota archaeon]
MKNLKNTDPESLRIIHNEVISLRQEGLSYNKIVNYIKEKYNVKISKATVIRWCNNITDPFKKLNLGDIKPSPELSYIIGAFLGDGDLYFREKNYEYRVRIRVIDKEFAEEFAKCAKKLGFDVDLFFERDRTRSDRWAARIKSKQLYMFLNRDWRELLQFSMPYIKYFLRGFYDAEGYPVVRTSKKLGIAIELCNSNKELLDNIADILNKFGIKTRYRIGAKKGEAIKARNKIYIANFTVYYLIIYRLEDIQKFYNEIGFTIKRKMRKLEFVLDLLSKYDPYIALEKFKEKYIKIGREYKPINN